MRVAPRVRGSLLALPGQAPDRVSGQPGGSGFGRRHAPRWVRIQPALTFVDEVPATGEGPGPVGRKFIAIALKQITQRVKLCPQSVRLVEGDEAADLKRAERNH